MVQQRGADERDLYTSGAGASWVRMGVNEERLVVSGEPAAMVPWRYRRGAAAPQSA